MKRMMSITLAALAAMALFGGAAAAQAMEPLEITEVLVVETTEPVEAPEVSALEARYAPIGSVVMLRGTIEEELQSGRYLFHDASGYILLEADKNAPYYQRLDHKVVMKEGMDQDESGHAIQVETIADTERLVDIVGYLIPGEKGDMLEAAWIAPTPVENRYGDAYSRLDGANGG